MLRRASLFALLAACGGEDSSPPPETSASATVVAPSPARKPWAKHLHASLTVEDEAEPTRRSVSCFSQGVFHSCGSVNPHAKRVGLGRESFSVLDTLLSCTVDFVHTKPEGQRAIELSLTIADSGEVTASAPRVPEYSTTASDILTEGGLDVCVGAAVRALAQRKESPQKLRVQLSYGYDHFCEDAIELKAEAATVIRVEDVKRVPSFALISAPPGHTLVPCDRDARWTLAVEPGAVSVRDAKGVVVGRVQTVDGGFEVKDAAGAVVRRGKTAGRGFELTDGSGKGVGWIGPPPAEHESPFAMRLGGMYRADGASVSETTMGILEDSGLDWVLRAATFAYLLER